MKIFKGKKKFKKLKKLKNDNRELRKENEHLRSAAKVRQQKLDYVIDELEKV